jgi:hypothetical protein
MKHHTQVLKWAESLETFHQTTQHARSNFASFVFEKPIQRNEFNSDDE